MHVSVVICTHSSDRFGDFSEAVESLYNQSYSNVEVVIVVDGNSDLFHRVSKEFGDRQNTTIELNPENYGLLKSRNIGAEIAEGDVVAFIDDDAVADPYWIESLVKIYQERNALAVGGKMIPEWVVGKPDYLPEEFYWLVGVTHRGFADGIQQVRNTFGSNISFKRDVFLELGGFDTAIGGRKGSKNLQGGETELCARLRSESNERVWYTPDALVSHKVFGYRTKVTWLIDRAFWQGYSKRAMETITPDSSSQESEFLHQLLKEFVPHRTLGLISNPTLAKIEQYLMLWVLTVAVGVGYLYGVLA